MKKRIILCLISVLGSIICGIDLYKNYKESYKLLGFKFISAKKANKNANMYYSGKEFKKEYKRINKEIKKASKMGEYCIETEINEYHLKFMKSFILEKIGYKVKYIDTNLRIKGGNIDTVRISWY